MAGRLRAAGLTVTTGVGGHGVVGLLRGAHRGRTVAYRADLDAVPAGQTVGGSTELGHLCGHDLHTTIGVGIAEVLARLRSRLSGTVAFVFQPAEENLTGAQAMLDDGVLRRTGAQEIHALHCGPMPVGTIAVTPGFGMPGLDRGRVVLTGPDAAARAEALAADILSLATVVPPESLADMEKLLVDLATPGGPLARFVNIQHATPQESEDGSVAVNCRTGAGLRSATARSARASARSRPATTGGPSSPTPRSPPWSARNRTESGWSVTCVANSATGTSPGCMPRRRSTARTTRCSASGSPSPTASSACVRPARPSPRPSHTTWPSTRTRVRSARGCAGWRAGSLNAPAP